MDNKGEPTLVTCDFCGKKHEPPGRYVYPVPSMGPKFDNRQGLNACPACYPNIRAKQFEEGLIAPALPSRINLHAWKENP